MSRLTEIIKQIPLDEMTGDVEMKERNNTPNNIQVKQGGMVGRRTGTIAAAAACAVLAAGGVFAYSRLSKPQTVAEAPEIISEAPADTASHDQLSADLGDIYRKNYEAYQNYYSHRGAEFSLAEPSVFPLSSESPTAKICDGLSLRMIGYRTVGTFIVVDLEVTGDTERSEFGLDAPECENVFLRTADGDIKGSLHSTLRKLGTKTGYVSFIFPQYQFDGEKTVVAAEGRPLTLSIGKMGFTAASDFDGAEWEYFRTENYRADFVLEGTACYDHEIAAETEINLPALLPELSRLDTVFLDRINYCSTGMSVTFTIPNASEEYCDQVLEALQSNEIYREIKAFGGPADENGNIRYMFATGSGCSVMFDKLDDNGTFIVSREFLDDPIDADKVTKFVMGLENKEISAEAQAVTTEEEISLPEGEISLDNVDISVRNSYVNHAEDRIEIAVDMSGLPEGLRPDLNRTLTVSDSRGNLSGGTTGGIGNYTDFEYNDGVYTSYITANLSAFDLSESSTLTLNIEDLKDQNDRLIAAGGAKLYIQATAVEERPDTAEVSGPGSEIYAENKAAYEQFGISTAGSDHQQVSFGPGAEGASVCSEKKGSIESGFEGLEINVIGLTDAKFGWRSVDYTVKGFDSSVDISNSDIRLLLADGREIPVTEGSAVSYAADGGMATVCRAVFSPEKLGISANESFTFEIRELRTHGKSASKGLFKAEIS